MNKLLVFGAAVATAILCMAPQQRSEAQTSGTLSCFVSGTTPVNFTSPTCFPGRPRASYTVTFLLSVPGTNSHLWNTGGYPISSGCTSTSTSCAISVTSQQNDQVIPVSVTLNGGTATYQAQAYILAVCAFGTQLVYC